ncbi:unnamed protein product [Cunninghamella blakesleeana]
MTVNETSKLYNALQQSEVGFPRPLPSKSYQPRRRRTSFGPTPSRTPSMTLNKRQTQNNDIKLLPRLEEENANLSQLSTEFILAQIEKQNALLDNNPKSVSISFNGLKAHLSTLQNLTDMSKKQPKKKRRPSKPNNNNNTNIEKSNIKKKKDTQQKSQQQIQVKKENINSNQKENDTLNDVMEEKNSNTTTDDTDQQTIDGDEEELEEEEDIDWEFWSTIIDDFSGVTLKLPHLVSAKLRAGIPSKVRGLIWQAMSQSASLNLETVYGQLLAEHSPYTRIIQRDLARTFPGIEMFKQEGGDGQQAMERVLTAYSLYDSLVGYCQGLAFLVGPLLMNMSEQQAFCVFVRLMETYEMRTMFTLNMEGLQLRLYQFSSLLAQILPELAEHLDNHSINAPMYASQWFLTLFAYTFPIPLVLRIYDIVFAEGAAETIMRVAIAMLKRSQDTLLKLTEFENILDYLTSKLYDPYNDNPSEVINDAMNLSNVITAEKMDNLAELYCRELEEEKKQTEQVMAARFNFWSKQQEQRQVKNTTTSPTDKKKKRESLSWLTSSNGKNNNNNNNNQSPMASPMSSPIPEDNKMKQQLQNGSAHIAGSSVQDVVMLHQQIEELLIALSQLQKDHLQVKQELVQIRMDKSDIEAESEMLKLTIMEQKQLLGYNENDTSGKNQSIDQMMHIQKQNNELIKQNQEMKENIKELESQQLQAQEAQNVLVERLVDLQNKYDDLENDKHKAVKEVNYWKKKQKDSEHLAQELQFEKIRFIQELEDKQHQLNKIRQNHQQVQQQHQQQQQARRRPLSVILSPVSSSNGSSSSLSNSNNNMDNNNKSLPSAIRAARLSSSNQQQQDYVARCKELEQMLSIANQRIFQLETTSAPTSPASERQSFDKSDFQKRSSIYGRFWSSFSSQDNNNPQPSPPSPSKNSISDSHHPFSTTTA